MCHIMSHNTGRLGKKKIKKKSLWIQNFIIHFCWGTASFPVLHTHPSSSGSVGCQQWGACEGDTMLLTPPQLYCHTQAGKRIPSTMNKQCYCHTLESLVAIMGWLKSSVPVECQTLACQCWDNRIWQVWMSQLWSPNMSWCICIHLILILILMSNPKTSFSLMLLNTV